MNSLRRHLHELPMYRNEVPNKCQVVVAYVAQKHCEGKPFNPEQMEAIAQMIANEPELQGYEAGAEIGNTIIQRPASPPRSE
jgi:hypothetical protein